MIMMVSRRLFTQSLWKSSADKEVRCSNVTCTVTYCCLDKIMEMLDRQLERITATCACNMTYVTMTGCEIYNYICQRASFKKNKNQLKFLPIISSKVQVLSAAFKANNLQQLIISQYIAYNISTHTDAVQP